MRGALLERSNVTETFARSEVSFLLDFIEEAFIPIVVVVFGIALVIASLMFFNIEFFDNVPVTVKVNKVLVYEGPSAGVDVRSSGANTTVSVSGGFLYLFPKAYYVSSDVELIGIKK